MTNENLAFAPISAAAVPAALCPATTLLDEMMARVGVDGLAAAYADPGLLALVDQHAAAVRDALDDAGRPADAEALAAYAKSVAFAVRRRGETLPEAGEAPQTCAAWHQADWHLLRLVAICLVADDAGLL
jgi:uncharacterized protein DUF6401